MEWFIAAFSLGFLGSFHCVGMCGPIALTIPVNRANDFAKLLGIFSYNFGRIITYSYIGFLFSLLGRSIAIAGFQRWLSISIGIIFILVAFVGSQKIDRISLTGKLSILVSRFKSILGSFLRKKDPVSNFVLGLLNGFLPCGLVYTAIGTSLAISDMKTSILFMTFFGMGTIPLMTLISYSADAISLTWRNRIRGLIPYMVAFMGFMLIIRGLNLGIPYLSPKIDVVMPFYQECK